MTKTWILLRFPVYIIAALVALFLVLLFYLWVSGRVWYPRQRQRIENLSARYAADDHEWGVKKENRFATSALDDDQPFNTLRMIASHNSYHVEPDWVQRTLIGLVEPDEPQKLRYSHRTLTEQLNVGVRSFELDVRNRGRRFTITHVPLVDNRGPNPDLPLALKEIDLWSRAHPDHVPIIILFELKSDWMFLDPGLRDWDAPALDQLDVLMRNAFPADRLLTPDDVRGSASSMVEAAADGWPRLGEMRGKVICVLHTDELIDGLYASGDPTLSGKAMFTSSLGDENMEMRPDAVFVIHNEPDAQSIARYLGNGLIVRTRADGDGSFTLEQLQAALSSGAQIVSTDVPPGHPNGLERGLVEFATGKTLTQR